MRRQSARAVPVHSISLLMAVALWLAYGAVVEKWPVLDPMRGLSSLFGGDSQVVQWIPGLRWVAIDGDTVDVPGHGRIRLLGVDTPELSPCRCALECELGQRAKRRTQELLGNGPLSYRPSGEDRYGRTLADITVDGRDLATILIREGLGRPYNGGPRRAWC
jgi:endonuclease YncB( thermonuclease family)